MEVRGDVKKEYAKIVSAGFLLLLLSVMSIYLVNITPLEANAYGRTVVGIVSVMSFATAVGGVLAIVISWILYVTVNSITSLYPRMGETGEREDTTS